MALKREFLKAMGLDEEKISAIIENHTDTVNALKKERDDYKATAESAGEVAKERDALKEQLAKAGDAAKVKADFDAYKQQVEADKLKALNVNDLKEIAREAGIQRASFIDMISRDFDMGRMQRGEDGKLSNRDELLTAVKEGYPDFLSTTTEQGTDPAAPPTGGAKIYTREEIKKMSPDEINKNWDVISKQLASMK